MKILIVDDDPGSRKLLRLLVESHGHVVIEAPDGQEGLEKAREHKPEAIISDALMPKMDGFQFLMAVRKDETLSTIPFVFFTAIYTDDKEYELALTLGADALIVKPKKPDDFWKEFTAALEKHTAGKKPDVKTRLDEKEEERFRDYCRLVAAKLEEKVRELEETIKLHRRTENDLRNMEKTLQSASNEWRSTFDAMSDAILLMDLEGKILRCNRAMADLVGKDFSEIIGRPCREIVHGTSIPMEACPHELMKKTLKKETIVLSVGPRWFEVSVEPFFDSKGTLLGAVHIMADVTEQKRNQEKLSQSEQLYRNLVDSAQDVIFTLGSDGSVVSLNPVFESITGWSRPESIGRNFTEFVHPEDLDIAMDKFLSVMRGEAPPVYVLRILHKSGGHLFGEFLAKPNLQDGKIVGLSGIARDITERKHLDDALKEAVVRAEDEKARADSIIAAIGDGITIQDRDFRILYQNQAFKKLMGDHIGELCYMAYENSEKRCEGCGVALVFEDGEVHTVSRSAPTDKGTVYVEITASPLRDSKGNIIAGIEVVHNITGRKLAEEQLAQITREWEETFNTITDMVTVHDKDFNIIRANKAAEKILGLPFLDVNKVKCFEYFHGTGCPPEGCPSCQSLETGKPSTTELFEPHLNMYIEIQAIPRLDSNNQVVGLIHVVRDITERKKSEEALDLYSRELTALNMASDTLMLITNLGDIYQEICNIIYTVFDLKMVWLGIVEEGSFEINPVAYAGFEDGYLSKIRVTWDDSPTGTGPTGLAIKNHTVAKANINDPVFSPWRMEAQKRGFVELVSVPLIYARDKCIGALNFYSDNPDYFTPDRMRLYQIFANQAAIAIENAQLVSGLEVEVSRRTRALEDTNMELQQLNKELYLRREEADSASRSKTDFLANMSHELRTPLNAILGFSEIMQQGMAGPVTEKQKEFLNDIYTSGDHLLTLITDILDLSKIEAGKTVLDPETFSVKELIETSLIMFKEKALQHHIKVLVEIDDTIADITADKRKLKQVMVNLLDNAFKFTPEGGSVRVAVRKIGSSEVRKDEASETSALPRFRTDGDFIEISVSDTGIGISIEHQQRLFQPFQQVETSLTRQYAGTGLGLSLCRRFIELHGGRIWVESEEGKGSRFVFIIPMKQ